VGKFYCALLYSCNHCCICCPIDTEKRKSRRLSLSDFRIAIEESDFVPSVDHVELSGGEPTLHPDFIEIVNYVTNDLLSPLFILSNSTRFSDKPFLERFLATSDNHIQVTTALYSHEPTVHDRITQRPGSFSKTMVGLSNLMKNGVKVSLKTIIQKLNFDHLPQIARFVNSYFPNEIPFTLHGIDLSGRAFKNVQLTGVRFKDVAPFLERTLDELVGQRPTKVYSVPICTIDPYYWAHFGTASKLPTKSYRAPNTETERNFMNLAGTGIDICNKCAIERLCPGVWYSYVAVYGTDELKSLL
jgi:MoaA/NifB/PqqE/SkfB family radical SAM enzyme